MGGMGAATHVGFGGIEEGVGPKAAMVATVGECWLIADEKAVGKSGKIA